MTDQYSAYKPPVPFTKQGLLFLPKTAVVAPRPVLADHFGAVYVGLSDISRTRGTLPSLHELSSRMSWKNAVFALSRISLVLNNHGPLDEPTQARLLDGIFNQETAARIRQAAKKARSRVFFFHKQQVLFLTKQALLRSQTVEKPNERAEMELLVRALLMTSDVLDHQFLGKLRTAESAPTDGDVLIWGLRNLLLNSSEELLLQFARHYQMYFVLARSADLQASQDFLDLHVLFEEATGVPLIQFMATGFTFMATFRRYELSTDPAAEKQFVIPEKGYLDRCIIGTDAIEKVLAQMAISPTAFRTELTREDAAAPDDTYAFLTFRKFPLLRLAEGYLMCLAPQFLQEKVTSGVYWTIFDHLKNTDKARLKKFTRFFGQLFEQYIRELCLRMIGGDETRAIPEFPYKSAQGERRTSDVVLIYPRVLVIIEVVNTKINMVDTVVKGDFASYEQDARRIVVEKAKQISRVIDDFKNNRFSLGGFQSTAFDLYVPVVVTSHSFPQHFFAWTHLEETMKGEQILLGRDILPLCVMDAEELELAEGVVKSGRSFSDVLIQKARDSNYRTMPFKNFLFATHKDGIPINNEMAAIFAKGTDDLTIALFGEKAVAEAAKLEAEAPPILPD